MSPFRFMGLAAVFVGAIGLFNSVFTVDQTQQVLFCSSVSLNEQFRSLA